MPELVSVPNVPGVPPVLYAPGFAAGLVLAAADTIGLPVAATGSPWGVYANGIQVVQADTVAAVDFKQDFVIADFPLERGAFESYNKVQTPIDVRLVFIAGGSIAARSALIASLDAVMGDLNLYDVVTPEKVYTNLNFIHRDFHRTAQNGVGMLAVSVWCQEVRLVSTSAGGTSDPSSTGSVGNTADPAAASQVNDGTVQATDIGSQPNASATLSQTAPNTVATPLTGTNATATPITGTNATAVDTSTVATTTATPIPGTTVGTTVTPLPLPGAAPQTSANISGLQAAGPDQYNLFGVSP